MPAHHLLTTAFTETWAVAPRRDVPFPLVTELVSAPMSQQTAARARSWLEGYARRGPPWQELLEATNDSPLTLVLARFVGVTAADLVRNLSDERWVLPLSTWLRLALDGLAVFERWPAVMLAEPPCLSGIGWSLRGELVMAPLTLNALLGTSADVVDHTALFSPEHVSNGVLDERSLVFMAGTLLGWLLTGQHPLEAEAMGHVGGLLRAERPLAAAWKLGSAPELIAVLERAMSHEPERRFTTIGALRIAVLEAAAVRAAEPLEAFNVMTAATHRLVDRLVEQLWSRDDCLPSGWEGLWPEGIHPLEGLSVVEDRLLEQRVDRRHFARRAEVGPSLRPWRTPPERAEDAAAFRAADRERWWSTEAPARVPWRG